MEKKKMKCDFCGCRNVLWVYRTDPFVITVAQGSRILGGLGSDATWVACQKCSEMVDAGDRMGLRKRAVDAYLESIDESTRRMILDVNLDFSELVEEIHRAFWRGKKDEKACLMPNFPMPEREGNA